MELRGNRPTKHAWLKIKHATIRQMCPHIIWKIHSVLRPLVPPGKAFLSLEKIIKGIVRWKIIISRTIIYTLDNTKTNVLLPKNYFVSRYDQLKFMNLSINAMFPSLFLPFNTIPWRREITFFCNKCKTQ